MRRTAIRRVACAAAGHGDDGPKKDDGIRMLGFLEHLGRLHRCDSDSLTFLLPPAPAMRRHRVSARFLFEDLSAGSRFSPFVQVNPISGRARFVRDCC